MGTSDNFYLSRRSVLAKKMKNHPIKDEHIDLIVKAGIRVPAVSYTHLRAHET